MRLLLVSLVVGLAGCPTSFEGSPHIDRATCQAKCAADGLAMAGLVYLGEYSSACVCEVPRQPPNGWPTDAPRPPPAPPVTSPAGALGAAPAVMMQMQRSHAQQHQH